MKTHTHTCMYMYLIGDDDTEPNETVLGKQQYLLRIHICVFNWGRRRNGTERNETAREKL